MKTRSYCAPFKTIDTYFSINNITLKHVENRHKHRRAWISLRNSTRFLTFGVRFSSTSECCPARDWILFCTQTPQYQNPKPQRYDFPKKKKLMLCLVAKTIECSFHSPVVFLRVFSASKQIKRRNATNLKSIDKACSILQVESFAHKKQKIKESNNTLSQMIRKTMREKEREIKVLENSKVPALRSDMLKLSLSLLIVNFSLLFCWKICERETEKKEEERRRRRLKP